MRALPGPTRSRLRSSFGGGGGDGYVPQPRVWIIPVALTVVVVGGSWVCDMASVWLVRVTGSGSPTDYLPVALWVLGGLAAGALMVFGRVFLRAASQEDAGRPQALPVGMGADDASAWIAAGPATRPVTVTAEVRDIPRALTAEPSVAYPAPDLERVVDADVVL